MLSKEEIKRAKKWLKWCTKEEVFLPQSKNALQYIEELESNNCEANNIISDYIDTWKELKDKLKKNIELNKGNIETNKDGLEDYWKGCVDTSEEILGIIGGENE